jgi:hypothetical protein
MTWSIRPDVTLKDVSQWEAGSWPQHLLVISLANQFEVGSDLEAPRLTCVVTAWLSALFMSWGILLYIGSCGANRTWKKEWGVRKRCLEIAKFGENEEKWCPLHVQARLQSMVGSTVSDKRMRDSPSLRDLAPCSLSVLGGIHNLPAFSNNRIMLWFHYVKITQNPFFQRLITDSSSLFPE